MTTDNKNETETPKRSSRTETERAGPLMRFGFPGEGEAIGGGATRYPKIRDIFFYDISLLIVLSSRLVSHFNNRAYYVTISV